MPIASNKSLPISDFRSSLTSTNSASSIRQPLHITGVCIMPFTGMGSIAKVLRSLEGAVFNHQARNELLFMPVANDSFWILQTIPGSIRGTTFVFPIRRIVFFGSI